MNNSILNDLLKQYEKKRIKNIHDAENRKKELYLLNPKLKEIDDELSKTSIATAKAILKNNTNKYLENLKTEIAKLKKEKSDFLRSINVPKDYLLPKYDCPICRDTGFILKDSNSTMCNCLKQRLYNLEYNQKNIIHIENQNFTNFDLNLFSNTVDKAKYDSDISPRENMKNIKKAAENFIKNFEDRKTKNLIFSGATGLGKTFLANCIINELLKKGKTIMYQTSPVMLEHLITDLFSKPEYQQGISDNLLSVDLLVIDDLGTETMNSMKFTELYKIINTRLLNQNGKSLKTIISTNLSLQEMFNTYDERLASRFIGYYDIYKFYGDDIRLIKR